MISQMETVYLPTDIISYARMGEIIDEAFGKLRQQVTFVNTIDSSESSIERYFHKNVIRCNVLDDKIIAMIQLSFTMGQNGVKDYTIFDL